MIGDSRLLRNAFSGEEQERFSSAHIAIIGLGGTGGFAMECLVRMGARSLVLFEDDQVEPSDFNRQILATSPLLGKEKSEAALRRAKAISPSVKVRSLGAFPSGPLPSDVSIVVDCTDNLISRIDASRACQEAGLPYVFCSAEGWAGSASVFDGYLFSKAFGIDESKMASNPRGKARKVVCPAAAIAGSLAASLCASRILGLPYPKAPDAIFFDLRKAEPFWRARLG